MPFAKPTEILASVILPLFPNLEKDLAKARLRKSPLQVLERALRNGLLNGLMIGLLSFFPLKKAGETLAFMLPIAVGFMLIFFFLELLKVKGAIVRRQKEIDPEVIFVGRYLLVKLYAGRPLLNALMETANSRGVAATYIREIVHDISTGTPIERALEAAMSNSPSEKFAKVLFHLNNALKVGVDVTKPLESVLQELMQEEGLMVKRYGKKLNSLVIFYMVIAVVLPSLGISLFMIVSNFFNIPITLKGLLLISAAVGGLQFVFISLFKSIRPMVDL